MSEAHVSGSPPTGRAELGGPESPEAVCVLPCPVTGRGRDPARRAVWAPPRDRMGATIFGGFIVHPAVGG